MVFTVYHKTYILAIFITIRNPIDKIDCGWKDIIKMLPLNSIKIHQKRGFDMLAYVIVMGRVYPNPKTRRVFGDFHKPEATRTRTFQNLLSPNLPEPEKFEFL